MKIAAVIVAFVVSASTGCHSTPGKVLGTTFIITAVVGNAMLMTSDRPTGDELDGQAIAGLSLVALSTLVLLASVIVESRASAATGGSGVSACRPPAMIRTTPGRVDDACDEACRRTHRRGSC